MMLHGEQQGKIDLGNHIELKRDYLENIFSGMNFCLTIYQMSVGMTRDVKASGNLNPHT